MNRSDQFDHVAIGTGCEGAPNHMTVPYRLQPPLTTKATTYACLPVIAASIFHKYSVTTATTILSFFTLSSFASGTLDFAVKTRDRITPNKDLTFLPASLKDVS